MSEFDKKKSNVETKIEQLKLNVSDSGTKLKARKTSIPKPRAEKPEKSRKPSAEGHPERLDTRMPSDDLERICSRMESMFGALGEKMDGKKNAEPDRMDNIEKNLTLLVGSIPIINQNSSKIKELEEKNQSLQEQINLQNERIRILENKPENPMEMMMKALSQFTNKTRRKLSIEIS